MSVLFTIASDVFPCFLYYIYMKVLGTAGVVLPGIEVKVVDPKTGAILKSREKGLIKVRGPQLMKGYYKVK